MTAVVYFYQTGLIFSEISAQTTNLRTFWCTFTGRNNEVVYQNWQISGVHLRKPIDQPLHTKIVDNNIFDALSIFNARKSIPIIPNLQEPTIDLHTFLFRPQRQVFTNQGK